MEVAIDFKAGSHSQLTKLVEAEVSPLRTLMIIVADRVSEEYLLVGRVFDGIPITSSQEEVHTDDLLV